MKSDKYPKRNKKGVSQVWGAKASAKVIIIGKRIMARINSEEVNSDRKNIITMMLVKNKHELPSIVLSYLIFEKSA